MRIRQSHKTLPPFSIRFSWQQHAELGRLAEGQSWGSHIKDTLFVEKRRPKASIVIKKFLLNCWVHWGSPFLIRNIKQVTIQHRQAR
ncbi:MAG: hypothetical protein DRQ45_00655 [Gammaproteobacteria bacterium]|nr:MAG: hypothetical protein DRQ45_00655 [Gammaproteobacteria bacterium]